MKKALFFDAHSNGGVTCRLCPHQCSIAVGATGRCRARRNDNGTLVSLPYGTVATIHLDPIEKKPLYHFLPGSKILSVGTFGCNLSCRFCQNWEISQAGDGAVPVQPLSVEQLLKQIQLHDSIGLAYTYNEPFINFEWMYEVAQLLAGKGLKNVAVTNGYVNPEPLRQILPFLHAANVDIKSFRDEYYRRLCGARLAPVLDTVQMMVSAGVHVEITTLVVTGENDNPAEIGELAQWIAALDKHVPFHLSRYFPNYKHTAPATDRAVLESCAVAARKHLKHVYVGNV